MYVHVYVVTLNHVMGDAVDSVFLWRRETLVTIIFCITRSFKNKLVLFYNC